VEMKRAKQKNINKINVQDENKKFVFLAIKNYFIQT
jgi:hypothetical protein